MPPSNQQRHGSAAPPVRVEVRHGAAPPVGLDVTGDEFIVGSVPGCDLRIPGANLPPQVCAIRRGPDGVYLQKIAQALPILLNGSPIAPAGQAVLRHGDVISIGAVDLFVSIAFSVAEPVPVQFPTVVEPPLAPDFRHEEWARKHRELETRAKAIDEQARELETDRVLWYERRQEMETEIRAAREELEASRRKPVEDPAIVAEQRAKIERDVAEEYRARREELERMQFALREAAVQLKEKKQQHEEGLKNVDPRIKELERREKLFAERQRAVDADTAELKRLKEAFDTDRRVQEVRLQQREQDLARREVELATRELATRELATSAERIAPNIRRISFAWTVSRQHWKRRKSRLNSGLSMSMDGTSNSKTTPATSRSTFATLTIGRNEPRMTTFDSLPAARSWTPAKRSSTPGSRRSRRSRRVLSHCALGSNTCAMIFEPRKPASPMTGRAWMNARATEERLRQAEAVREQVEADKTGHAESFRLYEERSAIMAQAVERLRAMQEQIAAEGERLRLLDEETSAKSSEHAEQAGLLKERAEQLVEAQERVEADRRAIKERDGALRQAEESREALQEQLRLRSEELTNRQREIDERTRQLDEQAKELGEQIGQIEALRADATSARRLTDEEAAILAQRDERLNTAEQTIVDQRHQLEESLLRFEAEKVEAEERLGRAKSEIEELKEALSSRTAELLGQMPDLEERAQAAIDRTAQARDAMRAQLAELHAYALKSQDDLDSVRVQVQTELDRQREQEQTLNRARSEHRLAVSSFRQQLIEWQNRFAGLKQALHHGETRLDRREKEVEAAALDVAERVEKVQQTEQEVAEKRTEVDRHLGDMQTWFRKKFREIVETRWSKHRGQEPGVRGQESGDSGILPLPVRTDAENSVPSTERSDGGVILAMPDDLDPADRKLGELLRALNVVERDTLHALWDEARRQRRTLRQVLLAGGYLTLYQLALIESGNLSGLMLGRFRVIDRLLSTPREAIYRVFDPQMASDVPDAGSCLLRHLGETEMLDAVRPDEYRQRFGAARDLAHPNVAATLEVLDINGRPAVVQEWLHGLSASDWPVAVASPGVWHRLMMQAALGLHAAHAVGLTHGRLAASSFLLTRPGVVKLAGVGEPPWLQAGWSGQEATAEDDLKALGQVALGWMQAGGRRKGVKPKPFPGGLIDILRSLGVTLEDGGVPLGVYPSAAALLEDLDRAADEVPGDQAIWEKLLAFVGENGGDGIVLRQSA